MCTVETITITIICMCCCVTRNLCADSTRKIVPNDMPRKMTPYEKEVYLEHVQIYT